MVIDTPISEPAAWEILARYVQDCLQIDRDSLRAVYATGSLGGGYYRPGQSDIDAVLIVANGSEEMWGNLEAGSERLSALNKAYLERYPDGTFAPLARIRLKELEERRTAALTPPAVSPETPVSGLVDKVQAAVVGLRGGGKDLGSGFIVHPAGFTFDLKHDEGAARCRLGPPGRRFRIAGPGDRRRRQDRRRRGQNRRHA